jgi:hypothetical protein
MSYNIPLMLGERGVLESVGFNVDGDMRVAPFLHAMTRATAEAERMLTRFRFPLEIQGHYLNNNYNTGIPFIDFNTLTVLPEEEALRAFNEGFAPFAARDNDWSERFWYNSNPSSWLIYERLLFFNIQWDPIGVFWNYAMIRDQGFTPVLTAIQDQNGGIHATVEQSVAIREGSPNYAYAWKFIKMLLSENIQYGIIGTLDGTAFNGIVVNNAVVERQISEMIKNNTTVGSSEGVVAVKALSMDEKQVLIDIINSISSASFRNGNAIGEFYRESMEPFFFGRQSHDAAMEELRRRLRIYISE